jgi:hypothetical protein
MKNMNIQMTYFNVQFASAQFYVDDDDIVSVNFLSVVYKHNFHSIDTFQSSTSCISHFSHSVRQQQKKVCHVNH